VGLAAKYGLFLALNIALLTSASSGQVAASRKGIGYVADLDGNWIDLKYGNRSLIGVGDPVDSDSRIARRSDLKETDFVAIRFADGRLIEFPCRVRLQCEGTLDLRRHLISSGRRALDFLNPQIFEILRSRYPALHRTLARSGEDLQLPDSLIVLDRERVDLSNALANLRSGDYLVEVHRVMLSNIEEDDGPNKRFDLAKDTTVEFRETPEILPGLFRVRVFRRGKGDALLPIPEEPWWLVCRISDQGVLRRFAEAQTRTNAWNKSGDEGARIAFRAYLLTLAKAN
jgi:hypothetical protein